MDHPKRRVADIMEVVAEMPDHQCSHEADIASLGTTTRLQHDELRDLQVRVRSLENESARLEELVSGLNRVVTKLESVVSLHAKTMEKWNGSIESLIAVSKLVAGAFVSIAVYIVGRGLFLVLERIFQ